MEDVPIALLLHLQQAWFAAWAPERIQMAPNTAMEPSAPM